MKVLFPFFCFISLFFLNYSVYSQSGKNKSEWFVFDTSNTEMKSMNIDDIIIDKKGDKWVYIASGGIAKYNDNSWKFFTKENGALLDNFIYTMTLDSNNNLWAFAPEQVIKIHDTTKESWFVWNENSHTKAVQYISRYGTRLVGCIDEIYYPRSDKSNYNGNEFGSGDTRHYYDLVEFIDSTHSFNKVFTIPEEIKYKNICFQITETDSYGNYWFTTTSNIYKISISDNETYTLFNEHTKKMSGHIITALSFDGINVWYGTTFGAIGCIRDTTVTETYYTKTETTNRHTVTSIACGRNGKKYFGTSGTGLVIYDGTSWEIMDTPDSLFSHGKTSIDAIAIDKYENKWLATDAGLIVFRENHVKMPGLKNKKKYLINEK